MDGKLLVFLLGIINYSYCAGLLRTPKVYNAVITTDENLTPSRAFPVIQPTIHETGIATYPFGPFNPYRFYNPPIVQLGQPGFPQGLFARAEQIPPQLHNRPEAESPPNVRIPQQMQPEMELRENEPPLPPPLPKQNPLSVMPEETVPIPLNEFGLPPSLVPVHSYPQRPINLQPYPYNNYPLIYESFNQYQDHLLPPYGYYPPHTFGVRPPPKNSRKPVVAPQDVNSSNAPEDVKNKLESDSSSNFDSIKNGITNKNSDVPDVPPPPLPSGAKSSK